MSQSVFQVTRNIQTLSDLHSKKYHPEGLAQVGSEYTYGQMHVYLTYKAAQLISKRQNNAASSSATRPPRACVIAQQYSTGIFVSLLFHSRTEFL